DEEDGELEFTPPFTINPMALNARQSDSSDSDGEALWSQISKEGRSDHAALSAAIRDDRPLFNAAEMASSPADKLGFTPAAADDDDDDEEETSDFM
ncbi:hypothetical protein IWW50_006469, partial [Coemansia erecta]